MAKDLIKNLDTLLDSNLEPILNKTSDYQSVVSNFLKNNKKLFDSKLESIKNEFGSDNYVELVNKKVFAIEKELKERFNRSIFNIVEQQEILEEIFKICPDDLRQGYYLKEESATNILKNNPPQSLMKFYNVNSLEDLFDKIAPLDVITFSRYSELPVWQEDYKKILASYTKEDFELRNTSYIVLDYNKYESILKNSQQPNKPWRLSHNKVTGSIICFSIDKEIFKTPFLQYLSVFIHYYFETSYAGQYYKLVAKNNPNKLGEAVLNSFTNHNRKFDFFGPNVYSETVYWQEALNLLYDKLNIISLEFFLDTITCGSNKLSLNLVDKIWDINIPNGPFFYHFEEAAWKYVFQNIINISDKQFYKEVMSNLDMRDLDFTEYIINKYK